MLNRFREYELILGALLATAIWILIFVSLSDLPSHYEVCETTKEGHKDCSNYNIVLFAFLKIGKILDSWSALIAAIATVFIARYTFTLKRSTDRLWEAGEKQRKLTEEAFIRLEGPLVVIGLMHMELKPGVVPTVKLGFKNHGRGPAILTELMAELIHLPFIPDAPPQVIPANRLASEAIIGAGQESTPPATISLTNPKEPGILFFWGYIKYKGMFGPTTTHGFAALPDVSTGTFKIINNTNFNYRRMDAAAPKTE